ncbi:MAG: nucleotidyltransferase domain-containing protein [Candidatus Pacebacteria bacterium]|nr:nucleotidyltransferase domain-containing protein [Candidatus Paceibacterota bacterium]
MLYALDDSGSIINEASLSKVGPDYRPIIDLMVNALQDKLSDKLKSIYVRGSVSVGRAQPNISDIDIVVILHIPLTEEEKNWCKDFSATLSKQYPFVTFVDLTCITSEELSNADEYRRLRVYLATQSVCLYGEDILGDLGKVKPSKKLSLEMYRGLDTELEELKEYFYRPTETRSYLGEVQSPEFWCVWTMRTLLRSGLGLVMCSRPLYTQDLPTCYAEFAKEFPEFEGEMKKALVWAHTPTSDKQAVGEYLQDFLPKYLELWKKVGL